MADREILSDGVTVWVNGAGGAWGRFGVNGIDVHSRDASSCLHCTHEPTKSSDWPIFQAKMWEHHGVRVGDDHRPTRWAQPCD